MGAGRSSSRRTHRKRSAGHNMKEAKDLVDSTPKTLYTGFTLSEAQDIKQQLEVAGATVALR